MGPPEGYSQGQVREGMSIPGRIRFTNRTGTKAIVTECSGYSNGSYPALAWSSEPCSGSVQTGVMESAYHNHISSLVELSADTMHDASPARV